MIISLICIVPALLFVYYALRMRQAARSLEAQIAIYEIAITCARRPQAEIDEYRAVVAGLSKKVAELCAEKVRMEDTLSRLALCEDCANHVLGSIEASQK
jgi:hypothetical protein